MRAAFTALRGVLYSVAFVLTWVWVAVAVRSYDARLPFVVAPWLRPVGVAFAIAGLLLDAWCVTTFIIRGRGTPAPFDPPREFVASGPYRYVRNPMYIGGFLVLLGAGLATRSPAMALLAVLFLLLAHLLVMVYEERTLERRFGESYLHYKATVRRWLPRVPS